MDEDERRRRFQIVRAYVEKSFTGWEVGEFPLQGRDVFGLKVRNTVTREVHRAAVDWDFLDDHRPNEIERLLHQWDLKEAMRRAGKEIVLVGNSGLQRLPP